MGDREQRDAIYKELLSVNHHDMSFDWFRQLYEEEFAQRKKQKQDFTPLEVSDRAIPLLLLNLSIRGIMGYVYHGDVLERTVKARYILLNQKDDALGFSDVVKAEPGDRIVEQ